MKLNYFLATAAIALTVVGCKKDEEVTGPGFTPEPEPTTFGAVNLSINHSYNDQNFALATFYYNNAEEAVSFNSVKYYVGDVKLVTTSGTVRTVNNTPVLINLSANGNSTVTLDNVPTGEYKSVQITLGMDHMTMLPTEVSALAETNSDLYFNDEDGFVFLRMRGYCPVAPNGNVDLRIGGCAAPLNAMTESNTTLTETLVVVENEVASLAVNADLGNVIDGSSANLSFTQNGTITAPCALGVNLARNFVEGISFDGIE